jgi:hypothetical protein
VSAVLGSFPLGAGALGTVEEHRFVEVTVGFTTSTTVQGSGAATAGTVAAIGASAAADVAAGAMASASATIATGTAVGVFTRAEDTTSAAIDGRTVVTALAHATAAARATISAASSLAVAAGARATTRIAVGTATATGLLASPRATTRTVLGTATLPLGVGASVAQVAASLVTATQMQLAAHARAMAVATASGGTSLAMPASGVRSFGYVLDNLVAVDFIGGRVPKPPVRVSYGVDTAVLAGAAASAYARSSQAVSLGVFHAERAAAGVRRGVAATASFDPLVTVRIPRAKFAIGGATATTWQIGSTHAATATIGAETRLTMRGPGVTATAAMITGQTRVALQTPGIAPARVAIYYGLPSLVNGVAGDLAAATAVFGAYDLLVLGDGLEFDAAPDHAFTASLIAALPSRTRVYGYVDLGNTQALSEGQLTERIGLWAAMGVAGVFLDEAGYDFGVTRARQNFAVTAAHAANVDAWLNAWHPDDVFSSAAVPLNGSGGGNPTGVAPVVGPTDAYLLESFAIANGAPEDASALLARATAAVGWRGVYGTRIEAVSTSVAAPDLDLLAYSWWIATIFGLDGYGWGMPDFSAESDALPALARPMAEAILATATFSGALTVIAGRWERDTTVGRIVVDPLALTGHLTTLRLLAQSDLIYLGAFRVPYSVYDALSFNYGGFAIAYRAASDTLYMVGFAQEQLVAEISIPDLGTGPVETLPVATVIQPFADVFDGRVGEINPDDPLAGLGGLNIWVGGLLPTATDLIASSYIYYDAAKTQVQSHWRSSLNLAAIGDATGPYQVGTGLYVDGPSNAGFVSGYMAPVPTALRPWLGGPAVTGNAALSIVTRSSYGPALFAFDPADLGAVDPVPATPLVYYPADHFVNDWDVQSTFFNGATSIRGVVIPDGTRSVLFVGRQGLGPFCYGTDVECGDPVGRYKGPHAYPYVSYVWAYDAQDLDAVRRGAVAPWDVRPYGLWTLDLPYPGWGTGELNGATWDSLRRRIYVTQAFGDDTRPVVHAFGLS